MNLLSRLFAWIVGVEPPLPAAPQWIADLKAEGYYVSQGSDTTRWRWYLPYRGFSCLHPTERSAWADAEEHYHQRLMKGKV